MSETKLSALVSACRRVSVSGKRRRPTVPARKKKYTGADGDHRENVDEKTHGLIHLDMLLRSRSPRLSATAPTLRAAPV